MFVRQRYKFSLEYHIFLCRLSICCSNCVLGKSISRLVKTLFPKCEIKILMVGLDSSGKTTILYKLKLGDIVSTSPTIGFNVESVEYKNINFSIWDVGGQSKIRLLWRHYFQNTQGAIFVVDSNDRERISEARNELHRILDDDELKNTAVLVFANKQDLPDAMPAPEVADKLALYSLGQRPWYIQGTSAVTGEGLYEGLDWLANTIVYKCRRTISSSSVSTNRNEGINKTVTEFPPK